jgi:hypothetical protein
LIDQESFKEGNSPNNLAETDPLLHKTKMAMDMLVRQNPVLQGYMVLLVTKTSKTGEAAFGFKSMASLWEDQKDVDIAERSIVFRGLRDTLLRSLTHILSMQDQYDLTADAYMMMQPFIKAHNSGDKNSVNSLVDQLAADLLSRFGKPNQDKEDDS